MRDLFNIHADKVILKATDFETYPDFDDTPVIIPMTEPEPDLKWNIARNFVVGAVAVVAVVGFIATFPISAPIAACATVGAVVLGGAVVVSNCVQDAKSGQARDPIQMFTQTAFGAVSGAGIGASAAILTPIVMSLPAALPSFGLAVTTTGSIAPVLVGGSAIAVTTTDVLALAGALATTGGSAFVFAKSYQIGRNGVQTTSKTTASNGKTERVDVENPNPGKRNGDIHYHEPNNSKWRYDMSSRKFMDQKGDLAPPRIQKKLSENWVQKGTDKALKILGEK